MSMNPDGTDQKEYYGSSSYWPNAMYWTRPIPGGAGKVVCVISGHHGVSRMGELLIFDPSKGRRDVNIKARALRSVLYGTEEIDLGQVAQLVDEGQVKAIGKGIELARREFMDHEDMRLCDVVGAVFDRLERRGLDALDTRPSGDAVAFRPYELAAAVNRLRTLRVRNVTPPS